MKFLVEKIHPQKDWHKNEPDELMKHIYWLHGQVPPKDAAVKHAAYQSLVRQLHAANPAPTKQSLDKHMNHYKNSAKKKFVGEETELDESVVSAAHATHSSGALSSGLKSMLEIERAKRKAKHQSMMDTMKKHLDSTTKTVDPEKKRARDIARKDMKEEILSELKKSTLALYVSGAVRSAIEAKHSAAMHSGDADRSRNTKVRSDHHMVDRNNAVVSRRKRGIDTAVAKLTKEEVLHEKKNPSQLPKLHSRSAAWIPRRRPANSPMRATHAAERARPLGIKEENE